ncbi:hypothetical protein [Virgibacillus doumboii]|uniref:hypothetical protein n=1 Tax=Virgibacillus doumboii TaxID=2697503 RepID=UPI0013DF8C2B|nr:hypothetical protein [Virgibacillus doumboii]
MESLYFVGGLLIFVFIGHLILRNDVDENNKLTRKGHIKFWIMMAVVFFGTITSMSIIQLL